MIHVNSASGRYPPFLPAPNQNIKVAFLPGFGHFRDLLILAKCGNPLRFGIRVSSEATNSAASPESSYARQANMTVQPQKLCLSLRSAELLEGHSKGPPPPPPPFKPHWRALKSRWVCPSSAKAAVSDALFLDGKL